MILHDAAEIQRDFSLILTSPTPLATLRNSIHIRVMSDECAEDMSLWTEIEAATRRSPEIAFAAQKMESEVLRNFLAVFAAETEMSIAEAIRHFSAPASFVLVMVKAASCLSFGSTLDQSTVRSMILRSIDQTLDDIAAYRSTCTEVRSTASTI